MADDDLRSAFSHAIFGKPGPDAREGGASNEGLTLDDVMAVVADPKHLPAVLAATGNPVVRFEVSSSGFPEVVPLNAAARPETITVYEVTVRGEPG